MNSDNGRSPRPGATFGVGSLPHRSVAAALDFVWRSTDVVPFRLFRAVLLPKE